MEIQFYVVVANDTFHLLIQSAKFSVQELHFLLQFLSRMYYDELR